MADEPNTTPATPVAPLANDPAARATDGTLKDQQATQTATTDTKTTATSTTTPTDAKADDKTLLNKDGKAAAVAPVVPEKYEFKAPEGYEIDAKFIEQATPVLKELGLTNDQAQKLVNLQIEREKALTEGPYKLYEETRNGWRNEVFKDPALGNGTELRGEVKTAINDTLKLLDPKVEAGLRQAMDLTGAGDNPAFVRAMYEFSKLVVREGSSVAGKGPSTLGQRQPGAKPTSAANALYPNLPTSSAS